MSNNLPALIERLNPYCKKTLNAAANLAVNRGNHEVTVEHYIQALLDAEGGDFPMAIEHYLGDPGELERGVLEALDQFRVGSTTRPMFSPFVVRWLEAAWMTSSVDFGLQEIRSGAFLLALVQSPARYCSGDYVDILDGISADNLKRTFFDIARKSKESKQNQRKAKAAAGASAFTSSGGDGRKSAEGIPGDDSALGRYAMNFTQRARENQIDPVFGRDREIRQMIDILARRRKNNPIIVGEAGVGKTALVEGLALRIVEGDVPDLLLNTELVGLDMGLLQAGASVKGEFEGRLRNVIDEVKASPKPIILFIDEAHTLIGAGGSEGGSDAANLLKPALARGELRTVAATTWSEYKKYFEKDAALSRRFQLVKLDEPDVEGCTTMLRGLRSRYEEAHNVIIRDDALVASAELGARYINGRQHPDKGIDLVDTSAARVAVAMTAKPAELEDAERAIQTHERELRALRHDAENCGVDVGERVEELKGLIADNEVRCAELTEIWNTEREAAEVVLEARAKLAEVLEEDPEARGDEDDGTEPSADYVVAKRDLMSALDALHAVQGKDPLVNIEVTPEVVARVVSDWTGIPLGRMVRDQAASLLQMESTLNERIKGQDHALAAVAERIRAAKAGLKNPKTPMGVFLFVGPSGVGKTETALGVADTMFGGERFLTTINMSEFQEKHTVSRLIGSPPGYVGYGEGGVLTEAVRQRPYSVVLLDEVEKAHPEVLNLFYQVFDKGMLADGEGRVIDFKDTILFLTSNLGSEQILKACRGETVPDPDALTQKIRPKLSKWFKPALLARMHIVPFYPINQEVMKDITRLKLTHLGDRLMESNKMAFSVTEAVVQAITDRCTEVETGARNIDHIINGTMLPKISSSILYQMSMGPLPEKLTVDLDSGGNFSFHFGALKDVPPAPEPPIEVEAPVEAAPEADA